MTKQPKKNLNILVADDEIEMAGEIKNILENDGYDVDIANDGFDALEKFSHHHYDLVLLDIKMPKKGGVATCLDMKQIKPDTPIVIITGTFSKENVKLLFKKGHIADVLYKPFSAENLLAMVKKYTFIDPLILIIDDDEAICEEMLHILTNETTTVRSAASGKEAIQIINKESIDLALLDLKLPDINGLNLIKDIKKAREDIYIIIITAYESLASTKKAIKEKVYDYLTKPVDPDNMKMVVENALLEQKEKRHEQETVEALKKFRKLAVGRELKMAKMKEEMEKIKKERA